MKHAVIIGAGLTGLTTAHYLKKAGWRVTLMERDNRAGGAIHTYREDGFVFESGPNTGIVSWPEVTELFEELGTAITFEPANQAAKRRLIWKDGRWHALPSSLKEGVKTPLFSWRDKFRLLMEPFRRRGRNPDETLAQMVKRRMGDSFLDYAVDPFILGIYAGDPSQLVTRYALPKLYNLEQDYGSFIKGSIRKQMIHKDEREKKVSREMFSMTGGLDQLIEALVARLAGEELLLGCQNLTINSVNNHFKLCYEQNGEARELESEVVIITTGAQEMPKLLPFLRQDELQSLSNLTYARVVQVAVGYKKWRGIPLNAFGGLVPHREHTDFLGILFLSAFLKDRAPQEGALLSIFMGGVRNPTMIDKTDYEIRELVLPELERMMMVPCCDPNLFKVFRHHHAIPQYEKSTGQRLKTIANIEKQFPGLIIGGNLRDGIGMADRIKQGVNIAASLEKQFGKSKSH